MAPSSSRRKVAAPGGGAGEFADGRVPLKSSLNVRCSVAPVPSSCRPHCRHRWPTIQQRVPSRS